MGRELDLVIYGATGFTGELVAEYLCRTYGVGDTLRWGLAGRSEAKLRAVRDALAAIDPKAADLALITADSGDPASLQAMVKRTRVVCTTVGPYALYGAPVVAACVEGGAHYCDLTGEPQFIRRMIDAHHAEAEKAGLKIVHCCGFDSIPSDLGTLLLQESAKARFGAPLKEVKLFAGPTKGGFSGGTVASLIHVLEEAKDPAVRKILGNPYSLNPEGERRGPDGSDPMWGGYDADLGAYVAPFVMGPINGRVVRRSNALMGYAYGEELRYGEWMRIGTGAKGFLGAHITSGVLGGFTALAAMGPTRALLKRTVLPAPGEGPDRAAREAGFFVVRIIGTGVDSAGAPARLSVKVVGEQDPGYGETAKMLGESAVCLAQDGAKTPKRAGILTPASAMGQVLIERLRAQRMIFEVEESA